MNDERHPLDQAIENIRAATRFMWAVVALEVLALLVVLFLVLRAGS